MKQKWKKGKGKKDACPLVGRLCFHGQLSYKKHFLSVFTLEVRASSNVYIFV